jgi:hypothetical protein
MSPAIAVRLLRFRARNTYLLAVPPLPAFPSLTLYSKAAFLSRVACSEP